MIHCDAARNPTPSVAGTMPAPSPEAPPEETSKATPEATPEAAPEATVEVLLEMSPEEVSSVEAPESSEEPPAATKTPCLTPPVEAPESSEEPPEPPPDRNPEGTLARSGSPLFRPATASEAARASSLRSTLSMPSQRSSSDRGRLPDGSEASAPGLPASSRATPGSASEPPPERFRRPRPLRASPERAEPPPPPGTMRMRSSAGTYCVT